MELFLLDVEDILKNEKLMLDIHNLNGLRGLIAKQVTKLYSLYGSNAW